jgi:hypothetical protein
LKPARQRTLIPQGSFVHKGVVNSYWIKAGGLHFWLASVLDRQNPKLFAVLGNCAAGDFNVFLGQDLGNGVVSQRFFRWLIFNHIFNALPDALGCQRIPV